MKNLQFNLILGVLTVLMGIFLFFEFQFDKDKYHQENIKNFSLNYNKIIENYEKTLKYSLLSQLKKTEFVNLIVSKEVDEIDKYLYINYSDFLDYEFRYLDIYDSEAKLIFSLNDDIKDNDNNRVLSKAVETESQAQGYFFTRNIQSYRFVYPLYLNKSIVAYIDFGVAVDKLLDNLSFDLYDKMNILLSKNYLKNDISVFKYKESNLSYNYYHVNFNSPRYEANYKENIQLELDKHLTKDNDLVIDILSENVFFNKLILLNIKDKDDKKIGYLVNYSNDKSLIRIIVLQSVKFILILLMVWLLYNLYRKNQESNYFSKQLLDAMYKVNIVSKTDTDGNITFVNKNFVNISGYEENELIGRNHNIVRHEEMPKEFYTKLWDTIKSKQIFNDIITNKRKDGSAYYVNSTIIPVLDTNDNITEFLAVRNDVGTLINASKRLSDDIKFMKDPCCVNIKIDQYEMYSSIYPQSFLNKLEKILLDKVQECKPKGLDFTKVYNLSNGEYAFTFEKKDMELDKITILLRKFQQNLNNYEIVIDNYLYEFNYLISFTTELENSLENQKIAIRDMSTDVSKETIVCSNGYAKESQNKALKNLETMKMIEDALNTKNLVSYFQAVYNIKDEKIEKYESLVRIKRNDEIISPYFFMDVAKKSGLYKKMTIRILENSFAILDKIDEEITINLSAADIEDVDIRNLLLGYFTTPSYFGRVTFEFLEDETIGDFNLIKDFISLARIMGGVKLAIDDFGSGYSNYERIVEIKPEILKIDGSLIKGIANNKSNQNIVKSIVQFAKNENIKTVAEFVSDEETFEYVKLLEIDYAQGYFLGKPCDLS